MTEDLFTRVVLDVADKIASELSEAYNVEYDEVRSVAHVEAYERKPFLSVAAAEEPWMIETIVRRAVKTYFHIQRVKALAETEQYVYQPEYVRLFLPYMFAHSDWPHGPVNEDAISEWRTGEAIDTAADMSAAFGKLREWQKHIIIVRHSGNEDWPEIARMTGRDSEGSARTAYWRATEELANAMNVNRAVRRSAHTGVGTRQALSNSKARAIAEQYN